MKHKGWIALDIDGTITDNINSIPKEVVTYLETLHDEGWKLFFITGRTFAFGHNALKALGVPYYFAVQHGADILEMPSKKLISRSYLTDKTIAILEDAYTHEKEDFVIYSGYAEGDFCYYRPKKFSKEFLDYLVLLKNLTPEPWKAVESFDFEKGLEFPLIKCIGTEEKMMRLHDLLSKHADLHVTLIKDPISRKHYLNLVTSAKATKGHALERIIALTQERGKVIAAGDDLNDITMLDVADIAIGMETGPEELKNHADIIAASASKLGIIDALKEAVRK